MSKVVPSYPYQGTSTRVQSVKTIVSSVHAGVDHVKMVADFRFKPVGFNLHMGRFLQGWNHLPKVDCG